MYEELVTRLRQYSTYNTLSLGKREDMAAAADAIEELSMRLHGDEAAIAGMTREIERMVRSQKPRWIPVTERLPEEKRDGCSDDVLMLVENPDGDITWKDVFVGYYLYDTTSVETGWWAMMTCDCVKIGEHKHGSKVFPANEYVTHWMPLPEPPKEEK